MTALPAAAGAGGLVLRLAAEDDAAAIAAIYAPHVLHGFSSFEEVPPEAAEIARRMAAVRASGLPYLVCELGGAVRGYAYASSFRARSAYRFTVEDSIYVHPDQARRGIGLALLTRLIADCTALGLRHMVAVIGDSRNVASIGLHARLGFRVCGVLPSFGYKHDRWIDVVMMGRVLGDGDRTPPQTAPRRSD